MGPLTLPGGVVYVDANAVIYSIEQAHPLIALSRDSGASEAEVRARRQRRWAALGASESS